jgi:hypothetical protein
MTNWINVDGLHDVALLRKFGNRFNLHPLALEDVLDTTQRPKVEFQHGIPVEHARVELAFRLLALPRSHGDDCHRHDNLFQT